MRPRYIARTITGGRYHSCPHCGGRVVERSVTVDYRWGHNLIAIIQGVPAGVCERCGERYFQSSVVRALESTAQRGVSAPTRVEVPVLELYMVEPPLTVRRAGDLTRYRRSARRATQRAHAGRRP